MLIPLFFLRFHSQFFMWLYFYFKFPERKRRKKHISALTPFTFHTLFSFFASILTGSINKVTLFLIPTLATSFWTLRPIRIVCTFWKKLWDMVQNKSVIYSIPRSTQHSYPPCFSCFVGKTYYMLYKCHWSLGGDGIKTTSL